MSERFIARATEKPVATIEVARARMRDAKLFLGIAQISE